MLLFPPLSSPKSPSFCVGCCLGSSLILKSNNASTFRGYREPVAAAACLPFSARRQLLLESLFSRGERSSFSWQRSVYVTRVQLCVVALCSESSGEVVKRISSSAPLTVLTFYIFISLAPLKKWRMDPFIVWLLFMGRERKADFETRFLQTWQNDFFFFSCSLKATSIALFERSDFCNINDPFQASPCPGTWTSRTASTPTWGPTRSTPTRRTSTPQSRLHCGKRYGNLWP